MLFNDLDKAVVRLDDTLFTEIFSTDNEMLELSQAPNYVIDRSIKISSGKNIDVNI